MFSNNITRLVEPPFEVDSKLYQSMQCADWICGLIGRLAFYQSEPEAKPEWKIFETYFKERINTVQKRSGIRTFGKPSQQKLNNLVDKYQN